MRLPNQLRKILGEIYAGGSALEPSAPEGANLRRPRQARGLHAAEDGMLTMATAVAVLALAVLIGLIGNAGNAVKEKIELQNAADSAAYSSALWMARGMNAITTTNHLLGELTALTVIHEALGGPELDQGLKFNPARSKNLSTSIKTARIFAPCGHRPTAPGWYGEELLYDVDNELITIVVDDLVLEEKEHEAGATIYDAKLRLKSLLFAALLVKGAANLTFWIPYPWGVATAVLAYVTHFAASTTIMKIGQEWHVLNLLKKFAKATREPKRLIEEEVVPLISQYGDQVAGYSSGGSRQSAGLVNSAIEETVRDLEGRLPVRAIKLALYPIVKEVHLPVISEPRPRSDSSSSKPGTGIAGQGSTNDDGLSGKIGALQSQSNQGLPERDKLIDSLNQEIKRVETEISSIDKKLQDPNLSDEDAKDLRAKKKELENKIKPKKTERDKLVREKEAFQEKTNESQEKMNKAQQYLSSLGGSSTNGNPSDSNLPKFDWEREKVTQWVRATYPHVDSFRAPILGSFKSGNVLRSLVLSNAAHYYTQWTNRYTLVKSYQLRDGRSWQERGNSPGLELVPGGGREAVRMYVLKDTFDQDDHPRKGREPWTTIDRKAEKLFTLAGFAYREAGESLFAPIVFHNPNSDGFLAHAQAIVYNANEQEKDPGAGSTQPKVGWDTLNWKPSVSAPEWGAPPSGGGSKWPWEVFSDGSSAGSTKIQLNWQAKLVPVTASRMRDARGQQKLPGGVRRVLKKTKKNFADLITH